MPSQMVIADDLSLCRSETVPLSSLPCGPHFPPLKTAMCVSSMAIPEMSSLCATKRAVVQITAENNVVMRQMMFHFDQPRIQTTLQHQ
jgi:hypothetical protein